jgi:peptide-methionine (S)-S-oxide reductase
MRLSNALGLSILLLPVLALLPLITARSESIAVRIDPPALDEPHSAGTRARLEPRCSRAAASGVSGGLPAHQGRAQRGSGYAGGDAKDANYQAVSYGRTGHAERCASPSIRA